VPNFCKIGRHRAAHIAKADKPDGFFVINFHLHHGEAIRPTDAVTHEQFGWL
jgi:hypothetical protein